MIYPVTDLNNCDKEPIHIPGRIQSYAYLVAINRRTWKVTYISDNFEELGGKPFHDFLDRNLDFLLEELQPGNEGKALVQVIRAGLHQELNPIPVNVRGRVWNLIVHTSGESVVLEFEPSASVIDNQLQGLVGSSLSRILEGRTLQETLESAVSQISELIGYDRVMIYKFWEDGHGEVVSECKKDHLEPFFGLHYPASDIPKQARELYKVNLVRIIANVGSKAACIVQAGEGNSLGPLDLTHAATRAVSEIHIQYLRNMGVKASFSVSLVANNELWGLIACHNYSPRFIDFKARQHAKLIGQVLSSSIHYRNSQDDKEVDTGYRSIADELIRKMHEDWSLPSALAGQKNNVLGITNATGAAVLFEGRTYLIGETPDEQQALQIRDWLQLEVKQNVFQTDRLPNLLPGAEDFQHVASGLLATSISRELGEYILFFKPERIRTVRWAGNPDKPVETGPGGEPVLGPRRSFDAWSKEVRGTSERWSKAEMNSVYKFREDLVHFINLKANEIRKLNERLKEAYDELDTFSFTISHDLKTPIASVKNYAEILLEDNPGLTNQAKTFLSRIIRSADKMNGLIREVMGYSRVSRQPINKQRIDMEALVEELKVELVSAYKPANLEFTAGTCPPLMGDRVMISQVFTNLLSNAIKYSAKSDPSVVKVEGSDKNGRVVYQISDNGIGIDMNYGGHIFELFKRMDNVTEYEGSGVGLAIVKRIMEKHDARIWYESEPGSGTIFYLSFQSI